METLSADDPIAGESPPIPPAQLPDSSRLSQSQSDPPPSDCRTSLEGDGHGDSSEVLYPTPVDISGSEPKPEVDVHSVDQVTVLGFAAAGSPGASPFSIGDFVWVKTRSHPWWPALVFDPSDAPEVATKAYRSGGSAILVFFFGSDTFSWCEPAHLKPFSHDFHRMLKQSKSGSFVGSVVVALDEIGRRLQSELTCLCIPQENLPKYAASPLTGLPVKNLRPSEFLEHLCKVACDVTAADVLQVLALKSWVIAFGKGWTDCSPGYHHRRTTMELVDKIDLDVPPGDLGDGNGEGDDECWISGTGIQKSTKKSEENSHKSQKRRSIAALIAGMDLDTVEVSDDDEIKVKKKAKKIKKPMKLENDKIDVDECRVEANEETSNTKEETFSNRRERKKSKYLSPPYTCLASHTKSLDSPVAEVKSQRKAVDTSTTRHSATLSFCNYGQEEDTGKPELSMEGILIKDIFSEFLSTVINPLHFKKKPSAELMIKSFFMKYRSLMYSSGSGFLSYQKHQSETCDDDIGSPKQAIVNDCSAVGKLAGKQKKGKNAAKLEIETGSNPKQLTFNDNSEVEKSKGKQKKRKDMPISVVETVSSAKHETINDISEAQKSTGKQKKRKDADNSEMELDSSSKQGTVNDSTEAQNSTGKKKERKEAQAGLSSNEVTFNDSSEVQKSAVKSKKRKNASPEVGIGFIPESISHSEHGKAGLNKRIQMDETNIVVSANVDTQVINVIEDVHENINSKDGATEESVVLFPNNVDSLQPTDVGKRMNKGKTVHKGKKTEESALNVSEGCQESKSGRKKKKSKLANPVSIVNCKDIAHGLETNNAVLQRKDGEYFCSYPGALLLTFSPGVSLPSQNELVSAFCKFGVVIESETELLKETNSARIVFAKSTDAEKAFNSSDKNGVFAPPYTSYRLHYLPPIVCSHPIPPLLNACSPQPMPPLPNACSPHPMPPLLNACSSHPIPPLPYIRDSLERMISTLICSSEKETGPSDMMKPDARENLVGDMEGLLKKVKTLIDGAASALFQFSLDCARPNPFAQSAGNWTCVFGTDVKLFTCGRLTFLVLRSWSASAGSRWQVVPIESTFGDDDDDD
ncbi:hypothetical protein ZIOFF_012189 [Zingiber officinale]|uniref:PWWP domain-containing protein n=1 Tax=Zingiber officinale TaxID=94328 RepID=A0A8J5I7I1_ZINOF|nr:hypothetical protein ZIOFF_012189 [Zingiber officinale]